MGLICQRVISSCSYPKPFRSTLLFYAFRTSREHYTYKKHPTHINSNSYKNRFLVKKLLCYAKYCNSFTLSSSIKYKPIKTKNHENFKQQSIIKYVCSNKKLYLEQQKTLKIIASCINQSINEL